MKKHQNTVEYIRAAWVPLEMVKFNPGLSQILSKAFLSQNMQLEFSKYVESLLQDTVMESKI